jgi:transcriptional regulator with XRE-family HTH domain
MRDNPTLVDYAYYIRLFPGKYAEKPAILGIMLLLPSIAEQVVSRRKAMGLSQTGLARKARISRATVDALENGRLGELGYTKVVNILTALGLELKVHEANARRPTLEELISEDNDDQGLDRQR